jgi:hypothetical protein
MSDPASSVFFSRTRILNGCIDMVAMNPATQIPDADVMEPTFWRKTGWQAKVIKNEDDDGWAVEIRKDGIPEPVLISPWVMGRDKKNPKPFDQPSFMTFVKTASEVLNRSARQNEAAMKKRVAVAWDGIWYDVTLTQVPDEYEPYAVLDAKDPAGKSVAHYRVAANYKFSRESAGEWAKNGFPAPKS